MGKTTKLPVRKPVPRRLIWLAQAVAGLAALYGLVLWALDSGKLQAYFLAIVVLIFTINRLVKTVRGTKHG